VDVFCIVGTEVCHFISVYVFCVVSDSDDEFCIFTMRGLQGPRRQVVSFNANIKTDIIPLFFELKKVSYHLDKENIFKNLRKSFEG